MNTYKLKQAGGTFLGIIIGLVIGLSIALVVALVITKTPVPFISKPLKDRIAEPVSGQMGDPNKALYGNKDAVREAAKQFAKEPDNGGVVVLGNDGASVKPAPEAKPADANAPVEDKFTYYLQVGAFREQADAESTKAKLALLGYETQISERPSESGAILYRVRLGPFAQVEPMNKIRSKLSDNGVDVAVVRTSK